MLKATEIESGMSQFYGTNGYHFNRLHGNGFVYTDGVKWLLENAKAYWLLDAIFSYRKKEDFQIWTLKKNEDNTATLTMKEDTNCPNLVEQEIGYTDFPLDEIQLWAIYDGSRVVLLLKSEY